MSIFKGVRLRRISKAIGGQLLAGLLLSGSMAAPALAADITAKANIFGGSIVDGSWYGNGNVSITEGESFTGSGNVYGLYDDKAVVDSSVTMAGGILEDSLYGGYAKTDKADFNEVVVNGGTVKYDIVGGYGHTEATGNKVYLNEGSSALYGSVRGGMTEKGAANKNEVYAKGAINVKYIYAGWSPVEASENIVNLDNCKVDGCSVNGGAIYDSGSTVKASNNKVIINNVTGKLSSVFGANVYATRAGNAYVNNNSVEISNAKLGAVYGGRVAGSVYGEALGNSVVLNNCDGSSVYGGVSGDNSCDNKVIITGGTYDGSIVGGFISTGDKLISTGDKLKNNFVSLTGVTATERSIAAGEKGLGMDGIAHGDLTAENNRLVIKNSNVRYVAGIRLSAPHDTTYFYKNNEVIVSGSNVGGAITLFSYADNVVMENNTIRLVGDGGSYGDIKGGSINVKGEVLGYNCSTAPKSSVNTNLEIYGHNVYVQNIRNFDHITYHLDDGVHNGATVVAIKGDAGGRATAYENVDWSKTEVTVDFGQSRLEKGNRIVLAEVQNKDLEMLYKGTEVKKYFASPVEVYTYQLGLDRAKGSLLDNDLFMTVLSTPDDTLDGDVPIDPEVLTNLKNMTETRAVSAFVVNESSDFMLEQGLSQAKTALKTNAGTGEPVPFAAVGGGSMRYKTGSHVDSRAWNGAVGLAKAFGKVTAGIAVNHGRSNYDSYMDNGTHGQGKSKSTGGSIFAELKQDNGCHFDAALSAGRVNSDYNANLSGYATSYKESSGYYGFSLGAGKEFKVNAKNTVDVYGRLYYNRVGAKDVHINDGSADGLEARFEAVNSTRTRLGARYTYELDAKHRFYAGLAWQHEFNGSARAVIDGKAAPEPTLKGDSGVLELGWRLEAGKNLGVNVSANGWTGKQKGLAGGVSLEWKF